MRIAIATCREYPALNASDAVYAAALEALGCTVSVLGWNTATLADFAAHDAIVIRATWDYPDDMPGFDVWLLALETLGPAVFNTPALMRWNDDKRCLLDLGAKGVAIPKTVPLDGGLTLQEALEQVGGDRAVLKPSWGGSGVGVALVTGADAAVTLARLQAENGRDYMVQEFLPEIAEGELSFVFIAGDYAHTVLKLPAEGEFRVNTQYQPLPPVPHAPSRQLLADAVRVLEATAAPTLYARVDGIARFGRLVCTELEVTEPNLYMDVVPETAVLMAQATVAAARREREPA